LDKQYVLLYIFLIFQLKFLVAYSIYNLSYKKMHLQILKILNLLSKKDIQGLANTVYENQDAISKLNVEKAFNLYGGGTTEDINIMNNNLKKIKESQNKLLPILKNLKEEINKLNTAPEIDPRLQIIQNQLQEMERIITKPIDSNEPVA